jgi:hypothetical protein
MLIISLASLAGSPPLTAAAGERAGWRCALKWGRASPDSTRPLCAPLRPGLIGAQQQQKQSRRSTPARRSASRADNSRRSGNTTRAPRLNSIRRGGCFVRLFTTDFQSSRVEPSRDETQLEVVLASFCHSNHHRAPLWAAVTAAAPSPCPFGLRRPTSELDLRLLPPRRPPNETLIVVPDRPRRLSLLLSLF